MNIEYIKTRIKTLDRELSGLSSYISPADKSRMISMIKEVEDEIVTRDEGLVEFENRTSRLISAILSLTQRPSKEPKNRFYNRYADFKLVTNWHIYREKGKDISGEPWVLEEEEKEPEKEEKEISMGDISEELVGGTS